MVLTLHIDKIESGFYRAVAMSNGVPVTEPAVHSSIAEAIGEEVAAVPSKVRPLADVIYGGASSGTIALQALLARSSQVADDLVAVVAEMHRIAQS